MEDFIGAILVFIVFVLGPILEQMRKKGQRRPPGPPPQQQRRPLPRPPESARIPQSSREAPPRVATQEPVATRTEEVSAAEMLPDELWEILTGQPKPRPVPPPPAPDVEDEETADEELITAEDVTIETRRSRFEEAVSVEAPPPREYPVVVSMEEVPDPRKRHAAFHEKIQQTAIATPARMAIPRYFSTPADLRRAIIMQVVLGPPKALEGPPQIR